MQPDTTPNEAAENRGCAAALWDLTKLMGIVALIIVIGYVLMRLGQSMF